MNIGTVIKTLPRPLRRHSLIRLLLKLSPGSHIQLLHYNDSAGALVDLNDACARQYLIKGIFEPEFFSIAAPFFARGGVFFDVGANFGLCSFGLIAELQAVKASYHLFEANEEICKLLSQSALLHKNTDIHINWCAVSDGPGTSSLQIVDGEVGQSFISPKGCQSVNNLKLDHYVHTHAIKRVNLMKMDIEGHEPLALRGAQKSLEQGVFDSIYVEVSTSNLSRNNFRVTDCLNLLKNSGFELFYCKPADFQILSLGERSYIIDINGSSLKVAPLIHFPDSYQTDILAVHRRSGHLVNL
jgi:FkbM family methyltransferase